jgi:hypothetical protein
MGLLDDAIREHLESKRLKGADPGDVAREERDALGTTEAAGAAAEDQGGHGNSTSVVANQRGDESASGPQAEFSPGQETVELDMGSMLGSDLSASLGDADSTAAHEPPPSYVHGDDLSDPLEWEVPEGGDSVDEQVDSRDDEDVLEQTPDFLRDTPEQERLWFEQRPPRDFDFNE